jgi:hypothetical protein
MKIFNLIVVICLILMTAAIVPSSVFAAKLPQLEAGPDSTVISGAY